MRIKVYMIIAMMVAGFATDARANRAEWFDYHPDYCDYGIDVYGTVAILDDCGNFIAFYDMHCDGTVTAWRTMGGGVKRSYQLPQTGHRYAFAPEMHITNSLGSWIAIPVKDATTGVEAGRLYCQEGLTCSDTQPAITPEPQWVPTGGTLQ